MTNSTHSLKKDSFDILRSFRHKQAMHVVCGLIERNNRILLARRPLHKRSGGLWEFPGGKLQEGENLQQALKRELMEELNIEVYNTTELGSVKNTSFTLHALHCQYRGHILPIEHTALSWVSLSRLKRYHLCSSDEELIKKYRACLPAGWFKEF